MCIVIKNIYFFKLFCTLILEWHQLFLVFYHQLWCFLQMICNFYCTASYTLWMSSRYRAGVSAKNSVNYVFQYISRFNLFFTSINYITWFSTELTFLEDIFSRGIKAEKTEININLYIYIKLFKTKLKSLLNVVPQMYSQLPTILFKVLLLLWKIHILVTLYNKVSSVIVLTNMN